MLSCSPSLFKFFGVTQWTRLRTPCCEPQLPAFFLSFLGKRCALCAAPCLPCACHAGVDLKYLK